ncbi:Response regulator receiver domain-containing protein [Flavobacterium resistens]|uniref:Response regulator n=1 Tax=Flavobacterium resistens TaxID=443612 RepID=A0A521CZ57_9FLAO|nr:response regulator [Flavobacterium resistens]MRX67137.1 response regulator [Flavobacterium resistens]SMO64713.1 Response regulator receiver domain-containing protein [Flavobacterium resistens]
MLSKPAFLLIEDNLIDQLVIKQLLKKILSVDEIYIANNGQEGLYWLENNKGISKPLFIILDIQMPFMNGFDFLDAYDKLDEDIKKENQIYVLSSTLDSDEISLINENKYVTKMLNKPFPIEEFKKTLYPEDEN